jgi:beta-glucanase (GH16 family)
MPKLFAYVIVPVLALFTANCASYVPSAPPDLARAALTFQDEFDGTAVDSSKWNIISRNIYYKGILSAHNPDMVSVQDGHLRIDLKATPYRSMNYSGGEIDTRDKFSQQYGYFEARMKMPGGSAIHSAWWLWPQSDRWPPEIDIVEMKGNEPTNAYMTVHWSENGIVRAHPEQVDFDGDHFSESAYEGPDLTQDFHVYGVEWGPDRLVWFIDGIERHRTSRHIPQEPFMLIIDLALDMYGGPLLGSTHLPVSLLVDYIRVYRLNNL